MLDLECFSFVNRAMESDLAPVLILASNRGICCVRGTKDLSPHGIPSDLLDRLLIISTKSYTECEIGKILQTRCQEEDIQLSDSAFVSLCSVGAKISLRYAIQILSTSNLVALRRHSNMVDNIDIQRCLDLFVDHCLSC